MRMLLVRILLQPGIRFEYGQKKSGPASPQTLFNEKKVRLLKQLFRDLDRIQRGAFEQLIAADPEAKAVVQRAIFADAANLAVVFFSRVKRHGILLLLRVIHDIQPGRLDRKSTRLNSSHSQISYAVFCL